MSPGLVTSLNLASPRRPPPWNFEVPDAQHLLHLFQFQFPMDRMKNSQGRGQPSPPWQGGNTHFSGSAGVAAGLANEAKGAGRSFC